MPVPQRHSFSPAFSVSLRRPKPLIVSRDCVRRVTPKQRHSCGRSNATILPLSLSLSLSPPPRSSSPRGGGGGGDDGDQTTTSGGDQKRTRGG